MEKNKLNELLNHISPRLRECLKKKDDSLWDRAEEIHLSLGKEAVICYNGGFEYVTNEEGAFICDNNTILETIMLLTENSVYSATDKLSKGFITISGGHRAGICGTSVLNNGEVSAVRDISSVNIRINREIKGVAQKVIDNIVKFGKVQNTLIISPPKCGKTTLLRDISRVLGSKFKVSVIDERSEIAAMHNGKYENDVGKLTDVLDGCPKHIGIPLVIRSMAPEVIITDEIGTQEDIDSINYASSSGVNIIASAHGDDIYSLTRRKNMSHIVDCFDTFIILTKQGGTGTIKKILTRDKIDL